MPSEKERLISVVTGKRRASIHDLRSLVGITSREQVEFEENIIA